MLPEPPLPGVTLERAYYDPLWSTLEELDVALALHNVAGTGLGQIGADRFGQWALPRVAAAFPLESQLTLFSFLVGGICDRHPGLRVVVLESGAGWLPFWLWWLDELYERYEGLDCDSLSMPPSDLFRRQCFISAEMEEPTVRAVVDALGRRLHRHRVGLPPPRGHLPERRARVRRPRRPHRRDEARHPLRQPQAPLPTLRCVSQPLYGRAEKRISISVEEDGERRRGAEGEAGDVDVLGVGVEAQVRQVEDRVDRDRRLHPREVHAEAHVRAERERHVLLLLTEDVERVGVVPARTGRGWPTPCTPTPASPSG